jgi:hypothetical protein
MPKSWKQSIWTEWPQVASAFAEISLINKFSIQSTIFFAYIFQFLFTGPRHNGIFDLLSTNF